MATFPKWRTESTAGIQSLMGELDTLLESIRQFRHRARKVASRIPRTSERLSDSIYDARDTSTDDVRPFDSAEEQTLDALSELLSCDPEDADSAIESLTDYRAALATLAKQIVAISDPQLVHDMPSGSAAGT